MQQYTVVFLHNKRQFYERGKSCFCFHGVQFISPFTIISPYTSHSSFVLCLYSCVYHINTFHFPLRNNFVTIPALCNGMQFFSLYSSAYCQPLCTQISTILSRSWDKNWNLVHCKLPWENSHHLENQMKVVAS